MAMAFSTQDVRPEERLSYWRDVMSVFPHDFASSAGAAFRGTVSSEIIGEVLVSNFECDPCEVARSVKNIAQSDGDDFLLCVQLSGKSIFSQADRKAITEHGNFVLIDPRLPFKVSYQGNTRSVSLTLPRRAFESRLGGAAKFVGRAIDAKGAIAGLVSSYLALLPSRIADVAASTAARLAEQTLDLVALAFAHEADQTANLSCQRDIALFRLKSVVEARLCDMGLKPAAVAAAAGISVRYANDLLFREGFSVERYVRHRRLERCRRALEDPHQASRLISEIAFVWGFSDLSHFARRFRATYGVTPSAYRRYALGRDPAHESTLQT